MSFFDDLKARAEESFNNVSTDIREYFEKRVTEAVVKVGEPPKGNLNAAQIAAGQTGAPQQSQVIAPQSQTQKLLVLLGVAGIAYYIFKK